MRGTLLVLGRRLSCVALLSWAVLAAALPQGAPVGGAGPPGQVPTIRVTSNLVTVPVSVTNERGEPVRTLKAEDFRIDEDGQPQEVARVGEPGQTALELILLFDISGSLNPRFDFQREAASRFLRRILKPTDAVALLSIGTTPKMVAERTANLSTALQALTQLAPTRQSTAFLDSVGTAARALRATANPEARRVAITLSDGEDNNSEKDAIADVLRELHHADAIFYAVNPSGPSIWLNVTSLRGQKQLEKLAGETGGKVFLPDKIEELDAIFARIAAELEAQYLLGYYPTNQATDNSFRRITVRVAARPDLSVRARQGYYATHGATASR